MFLVVLFVSPSFAEQPDGRGARQFFGRGRPFTQDDLPAGKLKAKLKELSPQARGKAMQRLHSFTFPDFDAAEYLRVDNDGGVYYVCPAGHAGCTGHKTGGEPAAEASEGSATESAAEEKPLDGSEPEIAMASVPVSSPPVYNSKPDAPFHIYLDFNGGVVTGMLWNTSYGQTRWDCGAWSVDADSNNFSDTEQVIIRRTWERVAEDYAPFNVNVTTDTQYDPDNTGGANNIGWVLITHTNDLNGKPCPHANSGGIAYVGVYGEGNYASMYQPAWVVPASGENMAEAASHEMGHNLNLSHDGYYDGASDKREYYIGHGGTSGTDSWAPIMGTGYDKNLTQWSKGEYYNSAIITNGVVVEWQQDDLAEISARIPYRADDHGHDFASATAWMTADGTIAETGIIETTGTPDVFSFNTGAGPVSFTATPYRCDADTPGGNLDIALVLYNSSFSVIASNNPPQETSASLSTNLAAGTYYLFLRPSGAGDPMSSTPKGYTIYGSLGQYTISGSIVPTDQIALVTPNGGESFFRGMTNTISWLSGMGGNVKIEMMRNGAVFSTIAASTPNDGSYDWVIQGTYPLGTNYRVRISSIETPVKSDVSVSDFRITLPYIYLANMDQNPGWTLDAGWGYGTPTGGGGDLGDGDNKGNPDPTSGYTGSNVIGYNLNGNYEANMVARWARTPAFNCSGYTNVSLQFQRWLGVEEYRFDRAIIQVSNNGSTWTNVWTNTVTMSDASWVHCQYDISATADGRAAVYLRWGMGTTDGSWQWCGWNIDDVLVEGNPAAGQADFDLDSDGDGLPDAWELANFGSIAVTDGTGDQDGDGLSDLHEYLAGTSPADGDSLLSVESASVGVPGQVVITWKGVDGKTYKVLSSTNLMQTVWQTNASGITGVSPITYYTNAAPGVQSYYLIKLE